MKIIEKLSDMIEEEMSDAEKYIRCAMENKEEFPNLAEAFYRLSVEEMQHMAILHEQVTQLINDYQKKNRDPPPEMMTLYNYLHKRHIDRATEIKNKQMIYKNPSK